MFYEEEEGGIGFWERESVFICEWGLYFLFLWGVGGEEFIL